MVEPTLNVLEACHRLAPIEGQKENKKRKKEKDEMGESKYRVIAIVLAVFGFTLIYLGATVTAPFFLVSIGVWVV
jgi:hypothetical protein